MRRATRAMRLKGAVRSPPFVCAGYSSFSALWDAPSDVKEKCEPGENRSLLA
jgi:hypothetical protein